MTEITRELLDLRDVDAQIQRISEQPALVQNKFRVAFRLIQHAREGDASALKLLYNYIDGMPKQTIDAQINGTQKIIYETVEPGDPSAEGFPTDEGDV